MLDMTVIAGTAVAAAAMCSGDLATQLRLRTPAQSFFPEAHLHVSDGCDIDHICKTWEAGKTRTPSLEAHRSQLR